MSMTDCFSIETDASTDIYNITQLLIFIQAIDLDLNFPEK